MDATKQELELARAIKEAALANPAVHTDVISDLEYLQHAIVAKDATGGGMDKALVRLERMQKFKELHGIKLDGSYEEGMRDFQTFQEAHPGFCLSLAFLPSCDEKDDDNDSSENRTKTTRVVFCCNFTNLLAKQRLKSDESIAILMRGFFYIIQAAQPNVAAMRGGIVSLFDGKDAGWHSYSPTMEERAATLYSNAYPMSVVQIVMMNANLLLRFLWAISSVLVSKKVRQRHVFAAGLQSFLETSPYGDKSILPTAWGGLIDLASMEDTISQGLQERYRLAETFEL